MALLAAGPVVAQDTAPLAGTAATFRSDLTDLTRLATTAALVRERTGAFPDTPFALLGSPEGAETGARAFPLSALSVAAAGDSVTLRYTPLPVPYIRENLVVTATVRPDDAGRYAVRHEMHRFADEDDGGRALLYDRAGDYRVGKGFGNLCIDPAEARSMIASGTYRPENALVATRGPLTLRVHPTGQSTPVIYEAQTVPGRAAAGQTGAGL